MDDDYSPPNRTPTGHCVDRRAVYSHRPGTAAMNFDRRCALSIQKLYYRPHVAIGGYWNKSHYHQPLQRCYCEILGCPASAGVFNLLSSRANLHLSYTPAGRSHCRLQNHHGYIKHYHRGIGGSPCDVGEVPVT